MNHFALCVLAALAVSTHGQSCSFKIYNFTSCTQTAYRWSNETSAAGCCATCESDSKCKAWEWGLDAGNKKKGNCHLKTAPGPAEKRAGVTCGVSPSLPPFPTPPAPPPPLPPLPPAPPAPAGSPNIVFFLTDDQDQKLGGSFPQHNGVGPMPKTKAALADKGATATNWFIHTPICCPSRSELVSGRYFHNIKKTGGGCMHIDEDQVNNQTFARYLHNQGYTVGMFGKYLNNNPNAGNVPPGIDAYMTNGGGNYMAPQFDTQGVADLGPYNMPDGSWQGTKGEYTTAVVGNVSMAWLKKVAHGPKPFFAYIAPKACHEPFTPAPWYTDHWDPSWPAQEPRPISWNCSAASRANHHGNIATQPMISDTCADYVTTSFKNRWRSLMSVDDVIHEVVTFIEDEGLADNTYFMYSSDHGFQLGEFNILIDKRQMYDHDTRIHLLLRGPGIAAGSLFPYLGTQVDNAPSWLGLAGVGKPASMDGRSFVPLLVDPSAQNVPSQTKKHIASLAPNGHDAFAGKWRDSVFIEYYFNDPNTKCRGYPTEDDHNNFIGIRHLEGSEFGDTSYTLYQTGNQQHANIAFDDVDFVEYFNLTADTWQMNNLWNKQQQPGADPAQKKLKEKLFGWFDCRGDTCP